MKTISHLTCVLAWRCTDARSQLEQPRRQQHARLPCASRSSVGARAPIVLRGAVSRTGGDVEPVVLAQPTAEQLGDHTQRLARQVTAWLDDEWLPQDVHRELGNAAAEVLAHAHTQIARTARGKNQLEGGRTARHRSLLQAYARQREEGQADIGSILLGIASDLQAFNFRETFTDAFEVANKIAELVMLSEGHEVGGCCVPGDAAER